MCPSKESIPPSPLVDNSHNEATGLSILSIHTESVMGTLGVVGVIFALVLVVICIYRRYIRRMVMGGQALVASSGGITPAPIPYAPPSMEYQPVRGSAPALMEGMELRPMTGARMIRNLSRDQLDEIFRVVQSSQH